MGLLRYQRHKLVIFTVRRSNAGMVLVVVLVLCVHQRHVLWHKETTYCRYFDTTWKGNYSSFLTPKVVDGWHPLPSDICAQSDPPPFKKRRLWQISAYNFSTVRASEKSLIVTMRSGPQAFQRAIDEVCTLPLRPKRVVQKKRICVLFFDQKSISIE